MQKRKIGLVTILGVLAGLFVVFIFPVPQIGSVIAQEDRTYWCGLFVRRRNAAIPNLAIHVSTTQLLYSTDQNGYVRIYNAGFTDGCPGQVNSVGITASLTYNNTEYAKYLIANQNVTLVI